MNEINTERMAFTLGEILKQGSVRETIRDLETWIKTPGCRNTYCPFEMGNHTEPGRYKSCPCFMYWPDLTYMKVLAREGEKTTSFCPCRYFSSIKQGYEFLPPTESLKEEKEIEKAAEYLLKQLVSEQGLGFRFLYHAEKILTKEICIWPKKK